MIFHFNTDITNRSQSEIRWSRQKNWAKLQCQPVLWKSSTRRQGAKATESVSRSFISFIVSTCYGKSHTKTIIRRSGVACWLLAQRNYRTIPVNTPAYQPFVRYTNWIKDHCLEVLRKNIQCTADVGLFTFYMLPGDPLPWPELNSWHTCRNFDAVRDWALEHSVGNMERPDAMHAGGEWCV